MIALIRAHKSRRAYVSDLKQLGLFIQFENSKANEVSSETAHRVFGFNNRLGNPGRDTGGRKRGPTSVTQLGGNKMTKKMASERRRNVVIKRVD